MFTDLSMTIFSIFAQMSVGAFIVLGVVQVLARTRGGRSAEEIDRLTDPATYAVGVTLVLGLAASIFHLGTPMNAINVLRHVDSSWLSREIAFGLGFAGLGFAFAAMQYFKWGSAQLRQVLAGLTALVGVGLVASMAMIYASLDAVPAWNTWVTPVQFAVTTLLLGSLAVGAAFMGTVMWRRRQMEQAGEEPATDERDLATITTSLKGIALASIVLLGAAFVIIPLHLNELSQGGAAAVASAEVFSGAMFALRLALVFLGAGLLGFFVYRFASRTEVNPQPLAVVATVAFGLVFVGEFIGRSMFYESMTRIGM